MDRICLLPPPRALRWGEGCFSPTGALEAALPQDLAGLAGPLATLWPQLRLRAQGGAVAFAREEALPPEAYRLSVTAGGIRAAYSAPAGALYAMMTLRQLALQGLPLCEIEDAPALPIRGYMLDISRGKVPAMETLKALVDGLARLKYNHLELYIEGFSFAYPSFPEVWQDKTPLTPAEVRALDAYCKARCIDLVPHQNSLGHMAPWLALPAYAHLAEGGLCWNGIQLPPTTLDACDEGSAQLVERLTADLLPNFTSPYFHVAMDEPFELGRGKNKARADREGTDDMYLAYVEKMHELAAAHGKTMMMWGDVIGRSETMAARLPKDIVVVDWGYEAEHPARRRAEKLRDAGLRFCMCAGTSTWSSFTGMTDNMIENITQMGKAAHACGAQGLILSDWGDMGHFQYLSTSWPGLCLTAAWAWNEEGAGEQAVVDALDRFIYGDKAAVLGRASMEAGRYYLLEEFRSPCRALAAVPLTTGLVDREAYERQLQMTLRLMPFFSEESLCRIYQESFDGRKPFDKQPLLALLRGVRAQLAAARPACADGALAVREYENALLAVELLCRVRAVILGDESERPGLAEQLADMMAEHRGLWLARNKPHGLEQSLKPFARLHEQLAAK